MPKYRKKPVVIEAIQWSGDISEAKAIEEWSLNKAKWNGGHAYPSIFIETLEGKMTATPNDYIIKGIKGEFYPCKPDIFEESYEEVTELTMDSLEKGFAKAISDSENRD